MQPFIVKLNDLPSGRTALEWTADGAFFESFGNPDILDARLDVAAEVVNHGATVDVDCRIAGMVTVQCDRCLDELDIPVEAEFSEVFMRWSPERCPKVISRCGSSCRPPCGDRIFLII